MKKLYYLAFLASAAFAGRAQCPITVTGNTVVCGGQSTTFTASSSATSFTWMPGGVISPTITVSPASNTTYTVYGTNGTCTDSATVAVSVTPTMTLNASAMAVCPGQAVSLSVAGATTYTWMPGGSTAPTTTVWPGATTTYTVYGSTGGCTTSQTVTINVFPATLVSISTTDASCGMCNGSLSATPSGGVAPYTYTWSPSGTTSGGYFGACAGNYTCAVTDANGCVATGVGTVGTQTASIYTHVTDAACGQANGNIAIDSVTGIWAYQYQLNSGSFGFSTSFPNLSPGVYTVTVSDSLSSCVYSQTVSVSNSNFKAQLALAGPTSCTNCNGSISTNLVGGTAPYTYSWSNGATAPNLSSLCAGSYQLMVTDNIGCVTYTNTVLASVVAPAVSIDSVITIGCGGVSVGSATVSATGGAPPYTYSWNTVPVQTASTATTTAAGVYTVTVTDQNGCASAIPVNIANSHNIYVYPNYVNNANCLPNGSADMGAFGGSAPYTYAWSNGQTTSNITNLAAGVYTVVVTDANGCSGAGTIHVSYKCLNVIKGRIYNDANQNCTQDVGENGLAARNLWCMPSNAYGNSDANGDYIIQTADMNPVLTISSYQNYLTPTCPSATTVSLSFTQTGDTITQDFGYWSNPNYFDLAIHPGFTPGHPGMSKDYWIYFSNNSPNTQNVLVRFTYDPVLQFDSANSGGVHYPSQHKIEWTFNNAPAGKPWDWVNDPRAYFTVPVSTPITQNLTSLFEILPVSGDANPGDNTVSTTDSITGSRDPNEKTVYPTGDITPADSVLTYYIHFQNNGNDTAYRVVVVDTLSAFLDPATIIPGASNHKYKFNLSGPGICTWTFDSIMLPDSLTNEPASNGYFSYTIRQKPGNSSGAQIKNTAYIYFDFNSAVVTNTTLNTVITVGVPEIEGSSSHASFVVYPNPAGDELTVRYDLAHAGAVTLEVRNILGEVVKTQVIPNAQKGTNVCDVNTSGLRNGAYVVRILNGAQQQSQKLIIQR